VRSAALADAAINAASADDCLFITTLHAPVLHPATAEAFAGAAGNAMTFLFMALVLSGGEQELGGVRSKVSAVPVTKINSVQPNCFTTRP
jgi:hypothetical protein